MVWFYQTAMHVQVNPPCLVPTYNHRPSPASSCVPALLCVQSAALLGLQSFASMGNLSNIAIAASVRYGVGHLYSFATFLAPMEYDTLGYCAMALQRGSNHRRLKGSGSLCRSLRGGSHSVAAT